MKQGRPSKTAFRVALSRAAHQSADRPRLLDDAIAPRIAGAEVASELAAGKHAGKDNFSRYVRAFVAARSRFAEDELAIAVQRGVRQFVVLGAGLDTFAYRNPYPALHVFEVDHPATQAWKQGCLAQAGIACPASLTFVPLDFEALSLGEGLRAAGFAEDQPAFFSWLGVTMYLSPETILSTLEYIASATPAGSQVVFDYVLPLSHQPLLRRVLLRLMMAGLAAIGEPWKAMLDPAWLAGKMAGLGFSRLHDLGQAEINARYFAGRADGLAVGAAGHLMSAQV